MKASKRCQQKGLLVVMAKEPIPGRVKTRLCPPLSPETASALYRCFLLDRIEEMQTLQNIDLALAYTSRRAKPFFMSIIPDRFDLLAQKGSTLSHKLNYIFEVKLTQGYAVAVIDSDTPDLTCAVINKAFRLLFDKKADIVLGPCTDGGYYLVAMNQNHPGFFEEIPWSTKNVLSKSLARAKDMRLKTALLPFFNDMDTYDDLLEFYQRHKKRPPDKNRPGARTFWFLKNIIPDL